MNVIPQRVKDGFVRLTGPLARALIQGGVHPNAITTLGTLVVIGSGVAFGVGAIRLGGLLLLLSGTCCSVCRRWRLAQDRGAPVSCCSGLWRCSRSSPRSR